MRSYTSTLVLQPSVRVLQVTTTAVYPPRQGGSHRAHGLVSAFPPNGSEVDRFCQGGVLTNHVLADTAIGSNVVEIERGYREHRPHNPLHDLASLPQALCDVPNVALSSWLRVWPSGTLRRLLQEASLVMVEGPLQVPGIAELADGTPVVYSSHNVETDRLESLRASRFGRAVHDRLTTVEQEAVTRADAIVCTSRPDAERFRELFAPGAPMHVAPNGTYGDLIADEPATAATGTGSAGGDASGRGAADDGESGQGAADGGGSDSLVAVFVGSDYAPYREAARALFDVMETLERRSIDAELQVVGDVCDALDSPPPNVSLLGFVDDLEGLLRAADVALNPITSGGGSNVKMLDYFGAGLPVVSTPFGTRGFDVTDGEHLLVRDLDSFPDALVALQDPALRTALGKSALHHVRQYHCWETISAELLGWYERVVV